MAVYNGVCATCSKNFVGISSLKKYCSVECKIKYNTNKRSSIRNKNRALLPTTVRSCVHCGKEFNPKTYQNKCCSKNCYVRAYKNKQPKIHINGSYYHAASKHKYKGNWLQRILLDKKCVLCGETERLEVHHIDGRGRKCEIDPNHRMENLRTLCHVCHRKMDDITWYIKDNTVYVTCSAFEFAGHQKTIIAQLKQKETK